MTEKKTTVIVSDLHLGGGKDDPGDDHVYQDGQFRRLIEQLGASEGGKQGEIELFINGDFLEFAQVNPDVYQLGSTTYWCSEEESGKKLTPILAGHGDIFAALKRFQEQGNLVTIGAGNHDVEFYWPSIQKRFSDAAGPIHFELGEIFYRRYDGKLLIGHGHMFDPVNTFSHWKNPILEGPDGVPRLEMCAGTLFMTKFVNWLEQDYPFSDNIKPVTALGRILWRENRFGFLTVSWMLSKFLAKYPSAALGLNPSDPQFGQRLVQMIEFDDRFAAEITTLYRQVRDPQATVDAVRAVLTSEQAVIDFFNDVIAKLSPDQWMPMFDKFGQPGSLGIGGDGTTLKILKANSSSDVTILQEQAKKQMEEPGGPQVVVMGHTHQPDTLKTEQGVYFNPGSWTRYTELKKSDQLTLADLKNERDFPYQLNYVIVRKSEDKEQLDAEMICFEKSKE